VGIGLGYVKKEFARAGHDCIYQRPQQALKAKVVKLPFVSK
jgi:glycine cleavage system aminomethyltransferase T